MEILIVHSYNPETGYYEGESEAYESPLEPGEFLLPAHSTPHAPDFQEGKIPKWNGEDWELVDLPAPVQPDLAAIARTQRNALLFSSDWTQLPDAPLTAEQKADWTAYRQALRNITASPDFPENIVWPIAPNAVL